MSPHSLPNQKGCCCYCFPVCDRGRLPTDASITQKSRPYIVHVLSQPSVNVRSLDRFNANLSPKSCWRDPSMVDLASLLYISVLSPKFPETKYLPWPPPPHAHSPSSPTPPPPQKKSQWSRWHHGQQFCDYGRLKLFHRISSAGTRTTSTGVYALNAVSWFI